MTSEKQPTQNNDNNPKWEYIGDECYDVTTSDGDVITVWPKTTPNFRD